MDTFLFIVAFCLVVVGLIGSIVPGIAGPPFSFLGLLAILFTTTHPVSTAMLIVTGVLCLIITVLDYVMPVWGTKKFGGTKAGTRGSTVGLIVGLLVTLFFPISFIAVLVGPFIGAYIGEKSNGTPDNLALRSAFGSFVGFLAGTFIKVVYAIVMIIFVLRFIIIAIF